MHIADVSETSDELSTAAAGRSGPQRLGKIGSLRVQFLALLCLAMGPVAILGIVEALSAFSSERHHVEDSYLAAVTAAAGQQQQILVRAYNLLTAVAQDRSVRRGLDPTCKSIMREALNATPGYASMIATDTEGRVICSSSATNPAASHADVAWLKDILAGRSYTVTTAVIDGKLHGRALRSAVPLRDEDGKIVGSLSVIVPPNDLEQPTAFSTVPGAAFSAILNEKGDVLVGPQPTTLLDGKLPPSSRLQEVLDRPGTVHRMAGIDGRRRMLAVIAMDPRLEMLFGQDVGNWWDGIDVAGIVVPLLLWLVALVTIWLMAERLVLRWTVYLSRIAVAYGRGHFMVLPEETEDAPQEFRELGRTLSTMARLVRHRQRQLQATLDQKSILVREVNHRIKNSLQIVQSLLNLQSRTLENRQQLNIFATARSRISALAMIHQSLYDADSLEYVELKPFFEQLCRHLLATGWGGSKEITITVDMPEVLINADIAVPLTMLVTEAVTNALKHAFTGRRSGEIELHLCIDHGDSLLSIQDDGIGADVAQRKRRRAGIGQSLIAGFARQLRGTAETISDHGTTVLVRFPNLMRR